MDFSKNAVAAVLHQQTEKGERFIAARTKTLKPYEKRYCSVCIEKHRVDLHDGEVFDRGLVHVWERVHVDLVGPFSPLSEDWNCYVLTVLDSYSRHVQVVPLKNKSADTVAEALVFKVLLEHGVPKVLYSDQGTEFKNQLMQRIAKYFGTIQKFS